MHYILQHSLTSEVLRLAYDKLDHNWSTRTYMMIERLYYWKLLKNHVHHQTKWHKVCHQRNRQVFCYAKLYFNVPEMSMQIISMDLIGEFHPKSSAGNDYALTVICMLTGYTFCVPIKTKTASEVVQAYIDSLYSKSGGSSDILSDNGTELQNQLFNNAAEQLGVQYEVYSSMYHPQSNWRIQGFHHFLKSCIAKCVSGNLEWDKIVPLACVAYILMPNEQSEESLFFLMFWRDPI